MTHSSDNAPNPDECLDLLIIGAGPAGLHAAAAAQDEGLSYRVIDRRGLAHSFVEYPQTLRFFSPPDEMEVAGVPLPMRGGEKPTREDILPYFRSAAAYRKLNLSLWESIESISVQGGCFNIATLLEPGRNRAGRYCARFLLLASGVWDTPNTLQCPGAGLPHVRYRFHEPTEYFDHDVVVVGGGNSAVHAALSLAEARARVTFVMRRPPAPFQSHLRPFVVRDLEMAVNDRRLKLITSAVVRGVCADRVWLQPAEYDPEKPLGGTPTGDAFSIPARFVFALLGQRPELAGLEGLQLKLQPDGRPCHDGETYETSVPRAYVAGSLAGQKIDIIITAREQAAAVVRRIAARAAQGASS
ncbi:MAG TPA: NAD(P)-binding domain-containing protein [Chthonomonadales bacterium]|nr:NAD(P)-binding domain-containing protein [Chthonomonadales bacterium]